MFPIIPRPRHTSTRPGSLPISSLEQITVNAHEALPTAELFLGDLQRWAGLVLPPPKFSNVRSNGSVRVEMDGGAPVGALPPDSPGVHGAYALTIDDDGILVRSGSREGIYRGLTSVIQLIGTADGFVPHAEISDDARYGWRGLSLDVARSFVPVAGVEQIIDLLALYKFSVLHLHLSDNEGWRLQIQNLPALTPSEEGRPREFYTGNEMAHLVEYAASRFITIVPELDLPGHVGAALRAYPSLNESASDGLDRPFPQANLDPGSAEAWQFADDVMNALCATAGGSFVHIGGDEAFGMKDEAHESFVNYLVQRGRELGKTVVGWQEISRADVGPGEIVQHWIDFAPTDSTTQSGPASEDAGAGGSGMGTEGGRIPPEILEMLGANFKKATADVERTAAKRSRVIMSPTRHAYLDRPYAERSVETVQDTRRDQLGLPYYPPTPLAAYLEWDPASVSEGIPADLVIGVEAALWTETASSLEDKSALMLPRLPAVAEVAWSPEATKWSEYRDRLARHALLWERGGAFWYQADSVDWACRPMRADAPQQ